jgi:hypothetical protein
LSGISGVGTLRIRAEGLALKVKPPELNKRGHTKRLQAEAVLLQLEEEAEADSTRLSRKLGSN